MKMLRNTALLFLLLFFTVLFSNPSHADSGAGNRYGVALPSLARSATVNSADIANNQWCGATIFVNISAYTSGTWTPSIQVKDPLSGNYSTVLTGTALSATGLTVLTVYPAIPAVANTSANGILPTIWRVVMTGATTPVATFSVSYSHQLCS